MNALVTRTTLVDISSKRATALARFDQAYAAMAAAIDAMKAAREALAAAAPQASPRYRSYSSNEAKAVFLDTDLRLPTPEDFRMLSRKVVDTDVWSHLIAMTDLDRLMDKKAKDQFAAQLKTDPPEATEENIAATMRQFALDADMIFRRGVAECFSGLDRRFRSHDGWQVGSRIILPYAIDEWGHWTSSYNRRDTIMDVERAFFVLDGKPPPPSYGGILSEYDHARRKHPSLQRNAVECETEYLRLRTFKNGNAHLWFKRDDLLEKVNKLLGEFYGDAIPCEREAAEDDPFDIISTSKAVATNFGFFPTPPAVVNKVLALVATYRPKDAPPLTVLEPSAGTGSLAKPFLEQGCVVDAIEIQQHFANELTRDSRYRMVVCADFLDLSPELSPKYDRIVMNPPFGGDLCLDHVHHAIRFLKPDGQLVAILTAGAEFRTTRKAIKFREIVEQKRGSWIDLPPGSFAESGTMVNTVIVGFWNHGHPFRH